MLDIALLVSNTDWLDCLINEISFTSDVIPVPTANKRLSAEPFDFEYGGVLSSSFGLRANKTYDLVKRSRNQTTSEHKSVKSSSSSPSPDQEPGQHSRNPSQDSLEMGDTPLRHRSGSSSSEVGAEGGRKPKGRKRSLTKDDSRSRLPSISQIQEKLRTRLLWGKKVGRWNRTGMLTINNCNHLH